MAGVARGSFAHAWNALLLAACAGSAPSAELAGTPSSLPRLRAIPLPAISQDGEWRQFHWQTADEPSAEPWATDAEAVQAVMRGLKQRVSALPAGVTLIVTSVEHSSRGYDHAEGVDDRGHTIRFDVCWQGVATDRACVVYVEGRQNYTCGTNLTAFEPVPGSDAILLTRSQAIDCVLKLGIERGVDASRVSAAERRFAPRLEYVWMFEHNRDRTPGAPIILAPAWRMVPDEPVFVDAVTGRVWLND